MNEKKILLIIDLLSLSIQAYKYASMSHQSLAHALKKQNTVDSINF